MNIEGWKYYNHAAIPTVAPHETVDTECVENGKIWELGGEPLLARWTTDFDCGYETTFWYIIREAPFDIEFLSRMSRKHIRQALKKCYVKRISIRENLSSLYNCYNEAQQKYKNFKQRDFESFKKEYTKYFDDGTDCWACYPIGSDRLVGYMTARLYKNHTELMTAKFSPSFLSIGVSYVLYYSVYSYYLNETESKYVSSGTRSVNHTTNTQEYKEKTFGCRKAYCKLNIEYNPKIKPIISVLYLFRRILKCLDCIGFIHQINAVLKMEELFREQKRKDGEKNG